MKLPGILSVILVTACSLAPAAGQTPQSQATPVKLSLKVIIYEGAAPTFYPVGDADKAVAGGLIKDFRRLPSTVWRNDIRVNTLLVSGVREGARVRVFVSAYGEDSSPGAKVAECVIGEGEEYAVTQLSVYGIEPLRLGVVRRAEVKLTPPSVDNRTRAVEVTAIDVHESVPSFEMTLRNVSDKKITAVEIEEMRGWSRKGAPPLFDWRRMPPLKPGAVWKVTLEFGWNFKLTPEGHAVEPADRVVIGAVLFTDGSYEGDSRFASRAEAFEEGRRAQLARALEIMRASAHGGDARAEAREIAAAVGALDCAAEWPAVVELAGRYPAIYGHELDEIKSSIEEGMMWQRSFVATELNRFALSSPPNADPLRLKERLEAMRAAYEQSLARH
jgi:hypothetical protein